jgi:adenylate kinase family enzyme
MVKMLLGEFPGKIPTDYSPSTKQIGTDIKSVSMIIGPPSCGKTTLREVMKMASIYICGHVSGDMSEIIDWHINPENNSPFREETIQADKTRKLGGLVNDSLVLKQWQFWLNFRAQETFRDQDVNVQRLDLSGMPRTKKQYEDAKLVFGGKMSIYAIDLSQEQADRNRLARIANGIARDDDTPERFAKRWNDYRALTLPFIQWGLEQGIIKSIPFSFSLRRKALGLSNNASLSPTERASIRNQMLNKRCSAYWAIQKIDHPKSYEQHVRETQISQEWHRGPTPLPFAQVRLEAQA